MGDFFRSRLRDAVFGTQDGLISTLGALTGIAAGTQDGRVVVLAGLVIIVVESLSMAAGSYLSSESQREYLEHLLREEHESILKDPEGERKELRQMYRLLLLEDMAHKELGITHQILEEPVGNAFVMGTAYVAGGLVPTLPYWLLPVQAAMQVSITVAAGVLFAVGAAKGRLVGKSWWRNGLEMLAVAGMAAVAGYVIGRAASRWL